MPADRLPAAMTAGYEHLLSPGRIGAMRLKNRMVHAPMSLGLGAGDGTCGERYLAYIARQARGGVGLINIGTVSVGYPEGSVDARQIAASDDKFIPNLKALADTAHAHDARIVLQLNHNGLQAGGDRAVGRPLAVPSVPKMKRGDLADCFLPEELAALSAGNPVVPGEVAYDVLDAAGIARIVGMFAAAAQRAKRAGIDGVEIHAGHGYLLAGFLSPVTNLRTDAYGGPVENRARFLVEVLRAVRKAVGDDFPVWCKIDSAEFELEGGITLEDAKITARLAEAAGADAISVSAYSDTSRAVTHSGSHTPQQPELLVPNAAAIKKVVGVPVITSGRIEAADADRHIANGDFDFVAFGRKLLTDPDMPRKLAEGRPEAVRPCIYCYSCISQAYFRRPILCAINPEMGREYLKAARSGPSRRVAVIGGGPVGMEAALRLKARGHDPVLLERSGTLGGAFAAAAAVYEPNGRYLAWLLREVEVAGIDVRLNAEASVETVRAVGADMAILAAGASRPGLDHPRIVRAEAMAGTEIADTVIVIGGGMVGLETAEWLNGAGKSVTVIDTAPKLGAGLPVVRRARLLHELTRDGVRLVAGARNITVGDKDVVWHDAGGERHFAVADVISAVPGGANTALADDLAQAGVAVHAAGDCTGTLYLESAIRDVADIVGGL